ncbi:class I SAM-dependent methyltransferase [Sphingomonadaceae bacterium jetA1]|uniref:class I SAM-dependent methyltransferase n=1 Tax=Facivitalis istanbulensis TaxID=3075838 RepID=UPI00348C5A91
MVERANPAETGEAWTRVAQDWIGRVGQVWAAQWRKTDRAFGGMTAQLEALIGNVAPRRAFKAFDIGCGAGSTGLALAAMRPEAEIVGVDLSIDLLAVARERAGEDGRFRFVQGDAVTIAGAEAPVDLFVSRHGVMFFDDPVAAFTRFAAAAAPGGAMVFSCFADMAANGWSRLGGGDTPPSASTAPGPFAFADPDRVRDLLARAGWRGEARRCDFAYRVGEGPDPVEDAMAFLTRIGPAATRLRQVPEAERPAILAWLREALARQVAGEAIDYPASAWLWHAVRQV